MFLIKKSLNLGLPPAKLKNLRGLLGFLQLPRTLWGFLGHPVDFLEAPGASWSLLGPSWGLLGSAGTFLGLEPSWGLLESPGAFLEPSGSFQGPRGAF